MKEAKRESSRAKATLYSHAKELRGEGVCSGFVEVCCYNNGEELAMSEIQKTSNVFMAMIIALTQAADRRGILFSCIQRDEAEIKKLNYIIDELRDENERLKQAAKGGEA